jgi:hypothetical protein
MRSSLRLAKSAKSIGSLVSETDDDTTVETTCTSGSWLVRSSAVATSFTRSMSSVLKLPAICPALAGEPMRASTSDQVCV